MAKLNQVIAIESTTKSRAEKTLTEAHHKLQKTALTTGQIRIYRPKDSEGEMIPNDETKVQITATSVIKEVSAQLVKLFDITATKEYSNCQAVGNIVVQGKVLLTNVPVTYLLFIDKQLVNLKTFVSKLPVLDSAERWNYDNNNDMYFTPPFESVKTKKIPKVLVKYEATDKHPAQTEVFHDDVTVGTWTTTKFSGALPQSMIHMMLDRIEELQQAVKIAREQANEINAVDISVGKTLLDFIFA